jgi:NAD(P)H-hydrate epimerase
MGHVLVIGGSVGLTGAAALCSLGALRAGAGLVTLAIPESLNDAMEIKLTEVMTKPFPETKARSFSLQAMPGLASAIEARDAMAIGPGLSQDAGTKQLVRQLLPRVVKPCVVDADALNALVEDMVVLKRCLGPMILTPHPGEMGRLITLSAKQVQQDRERIAKEFAMKYGKIVVLKGHRTVVANVDGELYLNDTGNPGMASGGFGDVLTGMIAGLLAQHVAPFDAARLGVYLHGLAGDLAAKACGGVGLIASDLLDTIPLAIRQYQSG